jgi:protein gp37
MIVCEPLLSAIDLAPYLATGKIAHVSVGGESGENARACDFAWVEQIRSACMENNVRFSYHQTGAKLIKDGILYRIPRRRQHEQAKRAGLDIL